MRLTSILVAFAMLGETAAVGADRTLTSMPQPFNERMTERVPVGGRSLVGAVATPSADLPAGEGLISGRLTLTGSVAGAVCVRVRTQDGRYEAENTYSPVATPGVPHGLAWSNAYEGALRTIPLREVAALTTLGSCGTTPLVVVPTGVDGAAEPHGPFLQVLVNTRGATTWAVMRDPVLGGPALARSHCTRLAEGARVAYDARCVLGPLPPDQQFELRLEQEGRDGLSLEVVAKTLVRIGDAQP